MNEEEKQSEMPAPFETSGPWAPPIYPAEPERVPDGVPVFPSPPPGSNGK